MSDTDLQNTPTIFALFGATGDLMQRKIVPALFHLFEKQELPSRVAFVGFSRKDILNNEFRNRLRDIISSHPDIKTGEISQEKQAAFLELFSYQKGLFQNKSDYRALARAVEEIDTAWGVCSNKLFYLAVPPQFYEVIAKNLTSEGMTAPCSPEKGWTRVIVEKPFGKNRKTARQIDETLASLFKEEQIYRIDHYLGKGMVQNILTFRFANNLFGTSWNSTYIERIDIHLNESIGVEDRGSFYDGIGALRDVGQNHLLQVLAFLTMDTPTDFSPKQIRTKRAEALKSIIPIAKEDIAIKTTRAQYRGYQDIEGVQRGSSTETFFRIETSLSSPAWKRTKIILEGGKRMKETAKKAVVTFRHPDPCLCPQEGHFQNSVTFQYDLKEMISIRFLAKKPGSGFKMSEEDFNFLLHERLEEFSHIEEYESLILDCIKGDQTLFVSTEEIEATWMFVDSIIKAWKENIISLMYYKPGTNPEFSENNK